MTDANNAGEANPFDSGEVRGPLDPGDGETHGPSVETIRRFLVDREIESTLVDGRTFVVILPGEKRLKTACHLTVNRESVRVEAFVCRRPDEDFEKVYNYLLRRNRRMYQVAYTLDNTGDIYLVGRMPLVAVTEEELDRVLGQVLEAADHDFNILLETGFHTAIRREFQWRVSRGESLRNLEAFRHITEDLPQPE
ncbi:MAG: YbjN domain-containing protein [Actinomycetales bacterium]|nr:YbjN domain-containing protein [Actinomycetales bacterium]